MDEDEANPSRIHSKSSNPVVDAGPSGSGKKRKLHDELEQPLQKHICLTRADDVFDPRSPLDSCVGKSPETESGVVTGRSFSGDYGFAECSYATYESKTGKLSSDESSSSASVTGGFYMAKDSSYSSGISRLTKRDIQCCDFPSSSTARGCISSKDYDRTQVAEDINQVDLLGSDFVVDALKKLQDEEIQELVQIQELLCSKDTDAGPYLLSSARWSISDQDGGASLKKPTIDQEFEQYFSSLMM